MTIPYEFNAASHFIDRHLETDYADKTAFIDGAGEHSFRELGERVNRAGNALRKLGIKQETRVAMIMTDTIDFPAVFWGAMKAGYVPVAINTLLTPEHYDYILTDCRAQVLVISDVLYDSVAPILEGEPYIDHVIVVGADNRRHSSLADLLDNASPELETAPTTRDDVAFWLYSSGSTGNPKGVCHLHSNPVETAKLYGEQVLGIQHDDVVYSAAKLFFAYGLGNAMTMPLHVGATVVLEAGRPMPRLVMDILEKHNPTIYCGVPTLYAAMLADPSCVDSPGSKNLRRCISAGEALPADVGTRWSERFGVDILDGVGSTEMLHIFLSNREDDVRYGTSGTPVPGYEARLVDIDNNDVPLGDIGELVINGPTAAECYWNQREKSLSTFVGPWTHTGDKYFMDEQGYYHYCGRTDDMFKSGGNWVSPFEVESALISHDKVLEAAVVAHADDSGNLKPKAFVVLKEDAVPSADLKNELKDHVKDNIEKWKYPRWIEFREDLPKTATGKIQRYKLRT